MSASSRSRAPIATHRVDLIEQSTKKALPYLSRQKTQVAKLTLPKWGNELAELCEQLSGSDRKPRWHGWVRETLRPAVELAVAAQRAKPAALTGGIDDYDGLRLRVLSIPEYNVTRRSFDMLGHLLYRHGSLTRLELVNNAGQVSTRCCLFCPPRTDAFTPLRQPMPALRNLSSGISQSLLRSVTLEDAKLSPEAFMSFIDCLDAPCLRELRLKAAMRKENISPEDSVRVAISIAHLLRSSGGRYEEEEDKVASFASPAPVRSGGRAPQLEVLILDDNRLTMRGTRIVVGAAVGCKGVCPPDRVLTRLRLSSTADKEDFDEDSDEEEEEQEEGVTVNDVASYYGNSAARRRLLDALRATRQRGQTAQSSAEVRIAQANLMATTASLRRSVPTLAPPPPPPPPPPAPSSEPQADERHPPPPEDKRCFSHITAANHYGLINTQMDCNWKDQCAVKQASLKLLAQARVLECRARHAKKPLGYAGLPAEIRLEVLRHVAEDEILSKGQVRRVMQWASDPTTIGYGRKEWRPPVAPSPPATPSARDDAAPPSPSLTLIPTVTPWSWSTMIRSGRSLPRDWDAEAYDEWASRNGKAPFVPEPVKKDTREAAADAYIALAEAANAGEDLIAATLGIDSTSTGNSTTITTPTDARRKAITVPSLPPPLARPPVDGAMLAFLEATGTRAPEWWWPATGQKGEKKKKGKAGSARA